MSFKRIPLLIFALALLLSTTLLIVAQDDPVPLLDALALVPDEPHGELYFVDFAAIEQAYPAAQRPANWAAFESGDNLSAAVWRRVFMTYMLPGLEYFRFAVDMPAAMGADFFQIDRALVDAVPPHTVMYLFGDFDPAAIGAALYRTRLHAAVGQAARLSCGAARLGRENGEQAQCAKTTPRTFSAAIWACCCGVV